MIYTIGHSNLSADRLLELLRRHAIQALGDVRSVPFSRFNPQFNRDTFSATLREAGIKYVYLGEELGARSKDPADYDGHRVSYEKLARSPLFLRGLERVRAGMPDHRIALMCAEREPLNCHRTILIARELERAEIPVAHILQDGSLETHAQTMDRLVADLKLGIGLFKTPSELLEEAYHLQAGKVSYVGGKPKTGRGSQLPE